MIPGRSGPTVHADPPRETALDASDRRILETLARARPPLPDVAEVAKQTAMSERECRSRLHRLSSDGYVAEIWVGYEEMRRIGYGLPTKGKEALLGHRGEPD